MNGDSENLIKSKKIKKGISKMIVITMIIVVVGESRGREIGCGDDVPYNYDRTNKAKITNFLMLYMIQCVRQKYYDFERNRPT